MVSPHLLVCLSLFACHSVWRMPLRPSNASLTRYCEDKDSERTKFSSSKDRYRFHRSSQTCIFRYCRRSYHIVHIPHAHNTVIHLISSTPPSPPTATVPLPESLAQDVMSIGLTVWTSIVAHSHSLEGIRICVTNSPFTKMYPAHWPFTIIYYCKTTWYQSFILKL